jgi:hypothetical protein
MYQHGVQATSDSLRLEVPKPAPQPAPQQAPQQGGPQ